MNIKIHNSRHKDSKTLKLVSRIISEPSSLGALVAKEKNKSKTEY